MTPEQAQRLTQALKHAIETHEPSHGMRQWYIDDNVIDCDADEFWGAAELALREEPL